MISMLRQGYVHNHWGAWWSSFCLWRGGHMEEGKELKSSGIFELQVTFLG